MRLPSRARQRLAAHRRDLFRIPLINQEETVRHLRQAVAKRQGGELIVRAEVSVGADASLDELAAIAHRAAPRILA